MKKTVLFFIAFLGCTAVIKAQSYSVALIPQDLKSYAKAVVRKDERTVIISSPSNMVYQIKKATTLLNQTSEDMAETVVLYNKSRKIKSLALNIYDANGYLIGKVKESDFEDRNYIDGYSLFQDDRIKSYRPVIRSYPVTVEEIIEIRYNQTLAIPDWDPQYHDNIAIEKASFEILKSPDYQIKFKSVALPDPEINTQGKAESIKWTLANVKANKYEPYSVNEDKRLPNLKISPVKFSYDGIDGEYTDWKGYGKWVYDKLLTGRQDLLPSTAATIKDLVKNCKNQKEAAQLIYEYAQKKNRYVSVQIGIGGFQPMKASEVDRLSYGDCKALVNYTSALLGIAGIESIYTEVKAGTERVNYLKDFASISQGNHIILCLPFEKDSVWLECTSKDMPFGFLGSFTQGRRALLIKKDGGELVKTPSYNWRKNLQQRNAQFELNALGSLNGKIRTLFSGIQYENRESLAELSPTKKEEQIKLSYRDIPDFEILSYNLSQEKLSPKWTEDLELSTAHFGTQNGKYLIFDINPVNVSKMDLKEVINRKNQLYINTGYTDIDTIKIKVPGNYKLETLPMCVNKSFDFGSYELKNTFNNGELLTVRKMIIKEGVYPPEHYEAFVNLYETAKKFDKSRCVLVKND
ncbi:DUF3857 domain-containing protein [Pelobium manganitolerans]|uniref:DUF3857 domain-containing protein n=1 Tax=Pelobium manganitolerans TaxID=1842495 RepID=UPI003FA357B3